MQLVNLFLIFLKIGLFTVGGGYSMLPMIQKEVVAHGWMSESELINFLAVSEGTPGSMSINMSTFIGYKVSGVLGSVVATLGVVLPSFLIILIVVKYLTSFKDSKIVKGAMSGLKPAVVGLILSAVITVGVSIFTHGNAETFALSPMLGITVTSCVIAVFLSMKNLHPILLILLCAGYGILMGILF